MNLASNGKPSNLTPEQYKLVRTKAFKDWFGDWENDSENASKVVDENGEPLVVYHFSDLEFNIFELKGISKGFFFTENKKDDEFSNISVLELINKGEYPNWIKKLMEQGLSIEEIIEGVYFSRYEKSKSVFLNIKKMYPLSWVGEVSEKNWSVPYFENIYIEKAKERNFNGIEFVRELDNKKIVVVFEPNQIKLADGSNTTFDSNNPDIRFDNGGTTMKAPKLLAPNGKPSNLTPKQYRLVRTPAFKAWFGDWERLANATIKDPAIDVITLGNISKDVSKVVDENGEPLVVYHGSKSNRFNSFNIISETHRGVEVGSHFGTYIQSQKIIAQRKSKNLAFQLYEVFLCIKNIIRVDDINWWTPANINKFIFQKNKIKISSNNPLAKDVIEQLNKKKINGFIYSNLHEGEGHSYVVFNPNQIKLADGTNTIFDGSNPDIRYSGGGVVDADIPTYLYHTTPSNNFQKIKQNGLSVAFDNRIYFTKNLSSSIDIANQLHKAYKENENVEFYHIWKIDTNKLTNPIFFKDEDYDNAVYITEPIPKNAIKYYESTKIKYADGGGYIGSCVDIGSSNKEVCEYFPNATIMAEYVGNPDENEWGKSKETTPKEFYKYVSKDDVPKKAINGEHTYHYIAQDGSNRDININETAIYFIYNIASDIHYFFKKTKYKTGGDLVNEPYISDNFQIGPNGAYEHTEESEIINQYADGVDLKKKLKKPKKPKGDCYYAAAQLVMGNRFKHLFGDNNITYIGTPYLVHAEVRGQGKVANIRFGHAWVEDDENIYDYSNGNEFVMPKEIYYAIGDIDNQNPLKYQKYTFEEARRKMVTTRHYGEWDLEVDC